MSRLSAKAAAIYNNLQPSLARLQENGIRVEKRSFDCSRPKPSELSKAKPLIEEIVKDHPEGYGGVLYLHIPFCKTICSYCSYVAAPAPEVDQALVEGYLAAMKKELALYKERFGRMKATHLYFGGGTPSLLSPKQLEGLFGFIRANVEIARDAEITFEVSPRTVVEGGRGKLEVLKGNGVNRVSMGVQSFDGMVLRACCRLRDSEEMVNQAMAMLRGAGFDNINLDLIYGLPYQTLEVWEGDLRKAAAPSPEGITTYHIRFDGRGIQELYRNKPEAFPDAPSMLKMKIMATEYLTELGYAQSPTDWFWKGKGKHIAQHVKWQKGESLLGIGVSAYSALSSGWKFKNLGSSDDRVGSIKEYIESIERGESPIASGGRLTMEEQAKSFVRTGLKTGIDLTFFEEKFGKPLLDAFPQIKKVQELGAVMVENGKLLLSYLGNLLAEEIAAKIVG